VRPGVLERERALVGDKQATLFGGMNALQAGVDGIGDTLTDPDTGLAAIKGVIGSDGDTAAEGTIHGKLQALQESLSTTGPSTTEPTGDLDDVRVVLLGNPEDDDDTGLVGEVGAIKSALTDKVTGLTKRVTDLETAMNTMQNTLTTMFAMREVDKILEGVTLPSDMETTIRTRYLSAVQEGNLSDPISMSQYTARWTRRHRGQCRVSILHPDGPDADLRGVYTTTATAIMVLEGENGSVVLWLGGLDGCYAVTNTPFMVSTRNQYDFYWYDPYYFPPTLKATMLLAVFDSAQTPPTITPGEIAAVNQELAGHGYEASSYSAAPNITYDDAVSYAALIDRYAKMARDGTVDEGVNYWYMLYQPEDGPESKYSDHLVQPPPVDEEPEEDSPSEDNED
jgi:hypothetical protein